MRILFWVPYPTEGASNRYRIEQYSPYLQQAGIKYSLHCFWANSGFKALYKSGRRFAKCYYFILGSMLRILDLLQIWRYDLVVIHREAYPIGGAFFETLLAVLKKPFIFDFDDAIFLPASSSSNNFIGRYKRPDKVAKIIKMSRHVIAGNRYLADFALQYNRSVSVIPTPIDTNKYYSEKIKSSDSLIIGWIGSVTTLSFLNKMESVFTKILDKFPNIKFQIVGGEFSIKGVPGVMSKPWSLNDELEDLKSFDIGIMPMPDNEWTKGKCGFKAILYMSMGIPCVCSPVGMNMEIISNGVNGFLAKTEQEWVDKLSLLIEDLNLRKTIGREARKTVEQRYSLNHNAPKYLDVLKRASKC